MSAQRSSDTRRTSPAAVLELLRRWRMVLYVLVLLFVGLLARWAGESAASGASATHVAAHAADD